MRWRRSPSSRRRRRSAPRRSSGWGGAGCSRRTSPRRSRPWSRCASTRSSATAPSGGSPRPGWPRPIRTTRRRRSRPRGMRSKALRKAAEQAGQMAAADPDAKARRGDILLELADTQQLAKQYKDAAGTYAQIMIGEPRPRPRRRGHRAAGRRAAPGRAVPGVKRAGCPVQGEVPAQHADAVGAVPRGGERLPDRHRRGRRRGQERPGREGDPARAGKALRRRDRSLPEADRQVSRLRIREPRPPGDGDRPPPPRPLRAGRRPAGEDPRVEPHRGARDGAVPAGGLLRARRSRRTWTMRCRRTG